MLTTADVLAGRPKRANGLGGMRPASGIPE